jgi:RNA polymerase subunit RPABC4/transcription elongation factor Spt4
MLQAMGVSDGKAESTVFHQPVGCDQCGGTGYRGRIGIYEVLPVTPELRRLIGQTATGERLVAAARRAGMRSFGEDGVEKVAAGVTSPEELLRVVTEVRASVGTCAQCGGSVEHDFVGCPGCGHRVGGACAHCRQSLQPGWRYCPYCTAPVAESADRQESVALAPRLRAVG